MEHSLNFSYLINVLHIQIDADCIVLYTTKSRKISYVPFSPLNMVETVLEIEPGLKPMSQFSDFSMYKMLPKYRQKSFFNITHPYSE